MKVHCNSTLISALLLSLCLVTFIPEGLEDASTWKMPVIKLPCNGGIENYLMPLGFITLGIVVIGLIVLWMGYRQRKRQDWIVMFIILLCYVFPTSVLQVLVHLYIHGHVMASFLELLLSAFRVKGWWCCLTSPPLYAVSIECGTFIIVAHFLRFLVMLFALFLPVKAFFWSRAKD